MGNLPEKDENRISALPLYRQVEHHLRDEIRSGALRAGEILPSVRELCERFGGINHLTVRQALRNLTEENIIRSVRGRGCFVSEQAARPRRVAIVLPHLEDTLFVRIACGAQDVFTEHGVHSLILDSRGSDSIESMHIQTLPTLPLDGAIIFPITHGNIAEQVFRLKMSGFNFVLVDRYFEDIATSCVMADNYKGGYDSAAHLIKQGHRRLAWIGETRSSPTRLRLQGIQSALSNSHDPCPGILIRELEIAPDAPDSYHEASRLGVQRALHSILDVQPAVEAILFSEDAHALVALQYLAELEIPVPERIALVGFDDVPAAALSRPALTTVRQPMNQIGQEAAHMLMERIQTPQTAPEKRVLPVELVVRETA